MISQTGLTHFLNCFFNYDSTCLSIRGLRGQSAGCGVLLCSMGKRRKDYISKNMPTTALECQALPRWNFYVLMYYPWDTFPWIPVSIVFHCNGRNWTHTNIPGITWSQCESNCPLEAIDKGFLGVPLGSDNRTSQAFFQSKCPSGKSCLLRDMREIMPVLSLLA